jgi:hypothetical protein
MEFRLPLNLQTELIAYDPQLKALARQQNATKKPTKKSKYPLGNIPHLIPYSVVRESLQQDAIDNINANQAKHRFQKFTTPVDVATPQARIITKAILYHYEQCWYAAWLPPQGEDYVYGFATAFKDTATTRKALTRSIHQTVSECTEVAVGRTKFLVYRKLVTKADIQAGLTQHKWRADHLAAYYDKARELAPAVDSFREALQETIPIWEDHREMFSRMRCSELWEALEINKDLIPEHKRVGWELTVDNLIEAFGRRAEVYGDMGYRDIEYAYLVDNLRVLNTPFFRKWMQQELNTCTQNYNDPANRKHRDVRQGFMRVLKLAECVNYVNLIWPDCPVDYFQQHMDQLMKLQLRDRHYETSRQWLRQHMPVASFFKIVDKYCEKQSKDKPMIRASYSDTTGYEILWFSDWNDTLSMISRVLNNDTELAPPKRWRLNEFHDYVQAESWKIQNPNEGLPQDLFPEPIKVQHNGKSWSFFQPHDTHQLAMWGRAVRNCVGSASGYAEGVRKKQHFIVLCMIDGQPQFTIQLKVSNGMMSVDQIRGLCNSTLTVEQKEEYTEVFQVALQTREAALKS